MIDDIYITVQGMLNKEQLGYLKPMLFNRFLNNSIRKVYNKMFTDLKSNVRKMNWMLDGKDFANYSEHLQQLIEFYSSEVDLNTPFLLPTNLEFVADVFVEDKRAEKVHYSDFKDLQRNIYSKPSECAPICAKVGENLKVSPITDEVQLHYIRKPRIAKWTFQEVNGKPMFDETRSDFQDVDMPDSFSDALVSLTFEIASIYLKENDGVQLANLEQQQDVALENAQ